jgi:uncharacterized protein YndB with AHSA1/START domain
MNHDMIDSTDAVVVTVHVEAPPQRAFDVFTSGFGTWWPVEHHIGDAPPDDVIIEPGVGGRWYERAADGNECDWGSVLVWDPPGRLVLAWHLNPDFEYVADDALATEVEVRFVAEGSGATRVELEHRGFAVHGDRGASMRASVGAPNGWGGILRHFALAA